jgi:hypothetical protein
METDLLVTLEPRKSPLKSGMVNIIKEDGEIVTHIVKRIPGFRGAAFFQGKLYLASPKSVRVFNRNFKAIDKYYVDGWSELHTIRIFPNGAFLVVSTNQNEVYEKDLIKGTKWKSIYKGWSRSHLNTLDHNRVMSLHGKVVDLTDGSTVWESDVFKRTHNYTKLLDGGSLLLSENWVVYNDKCFYAEEGRFMRGLYVHYPFFYVGVNSFLDRKNMDEFEYKPPKVMMFHIEKGFIKEWVLPATKPWVIYDIIKCEW